MYETGSESGQGTIRCLKNTVCRKTGQNLRSSRGRYERRSSWLMAFEFSADSPPVSLVSVRSSDELMSIENKVRRVVAHSSILFKLSMF